MTAGGAGSSVACDVGHLAVKFLERHADLAAGQVGAEAEVRAAAAETDVGIGCAPTSKVHGSANFASSRLAEQYHSETLSPAAIFTPLSSQSSVSVRRM